MRYRVDDLPAKGVGAFTPLPTTNPLASSWGLVHVSGAPGTLPIATPKPQRKWLPALTRRAAPDTAQGSDSAPDIALPSIYVASAANMGPAADLGLGMHARRLNPLPVPALDPTRVAVPVQAAPRVGGRGALPWPRTFQRYPNEA